MRLLAFETAESPGSLALLESSGDGVTVVYEAQLPASSRTTESYAPAIMQALKFCDWSPHDLDRVAVSVGPGSFTGLRIGVTVAKTYAYATGCEVVGIPSLQTLASQFPADQPTPVWAMMNAQRKQLFVAKFEVGAAGSAPEPLSDVTIENAQSWIATLAIGSHLIGNGLALWQGKIEGLSRMELADRTDWSLRASSLGRLAVMRRSVDDLWDLAPQYFRKSAAEEKLENQSPG